MRWRKKEESPLLFAAPICSEGAGGVLFTVLCMCVKRGGLEERTGSEKEGVEGWKG